MRAAGIRCSAARGGMRSLVWLWHTAQCFWYTISPESAAKPFRISSQISSITESIDLGPFGSNQRVVRLRAPTQANVTGETKVATDETLDFG